MAIDLGKEIGRTAFNTLNTSAIHLKGDIQEKFYSGKSDTSLGRRTGTASRGWKVLKESNTAVAIINNVKYADHSKERVIKPKQSKYLAIPIEEALTNAGVARYSGPRDPTLPDLEVMGTRDKDTLLLVGVGRGNKKKKKAYFVLKKEVRIPARTAGLLPFVEQQGDVIAERINDELFKVVDKFKLFDAEGEVT